MCCRSTASRPAPAALPVPLVAEPEHIGVQFNKTDLEFVLRQILQAEAGQPPVSPHLAFGLREVAGTDNNSVPGQETFGAADEVFPRVTEPLFRTVTVNNAARFSIRTRALPATS